MRSLWLKAATKDVWTLLRFTHLNTHSGEQVQTKVYNNFMQKKA
jgi:hypothetical protein